MEYPIIKSMQATTIETNSNELSFPQTMVSHYDFEIAFSPILTVSFKTDKFSSNEDVIKQAKDLMSISSAS